MPEEPIIDLGYAEVPDEPDRPLRATVGHLRPIGAVALVLVCLLFVGGAAQPPPALLARLGVVDWSDGRVVDDRMPNLVAGRLVMPAGDEVLAYHPDGRLAWRSRPDFDYGSDPGFFDIFELAGAVAVVRLSLRSFSSGTSRASALETLGLDPATGRELWRLEGAARRIGDFFVSYGEASDGEQRARVYRSLPDELLWSTPAARIMAADPATDALMTVTGDGIFTEHALSTGAVRKTGRMQMPQVASAEGTVGLRVLRDRLIVYSLQYGMNEPTVQAQGYDRATLQPLAQAPVDLFVGTDECGPVLCGFSYKEVSIVDRDTHAVLWRAATGESLVWSTSGLLAGDSKLRLVDPRTGRTLVDASGWEAVYHLRRSPGQQAPAVVIRRLDDRTYVGHLTPQGIRVLGSVPRLLRDCQSYQDLMVCAAPRDGAEVWRLDLSG